MQSGDHAAQTELCVAAPTSFRRAARVSATIWAYHATSGARVARGDSKSKVTPSRKCALT